MMKPTAYAYFVIELAPSGGFRALGNGTVIAREAVVSAGVAVGVNCGYHQHRHGMR